MAISIPMVPEASNKGNREKKKVIVFGIGTNDLCMHPQFVTSCDALLPSVMRR